LRQYGGHITDPWDRRTNNTYLQVLFNPELLKGGDLAPFVDTHADEDDASYGDDDAGAHPAVLAACFHSSVSLIDV
jgi:hypothetical protein